MVFRENEVDIGVSIWAVHCLFFLSRRAIVGVLVSQMCGQGCCFLLVGFLFYFIYSCMRIFDLNDVFSTTRPA